MPQPSKEPCKKQACDIQACLSKNNFTSHKSYRQNPCLGCNICVKMLLGKGTICPSIRTEVNQTKGCVKVIELLQSCCEQCHNKSTHCASVSGLLKQINKK